MIQTKPSVFRTCEVKPTGILYGGAHIGEDIPYFKYVMNEELGLPSDGGNEFILAVEPNPKAFGKLSQQSSGNVRCVLGALADKDGSVDYYSTPGLPRLNSTLEPDLDFWTKQFGSTMVKQHPVERTTVKAFSIDGLLAEAGRPCNVIYLNIQGAELQALSGAREALSNQVEAVFTEVNFAARYKNSPLFDEISEFLGRYGFVLAYLQKFRLMGFSAGEALFVKPRAASPK